jgi:hypothetical protein
MNPVETAAEVGGLGVERERYELVRATFVLIANQLVRSIEASMTLAYMRLRYLGTVPITKNWKEPGGCIPA